LYSQALLHFFNNSSFSKLLPRMAPFRTPNRRNSEGGKFGVYGGWGRTVNPSFVIVSFILRRVFVWASFVVLKDFSNVFVRSKSLETLL
jgi:hypothetical protein